MKSAQVFRSWACLACLVVATGFAGPSQAAPDRCKTGIDKVQAEFDAKLARRAKAGPFAKESTFATQGRQPTPQTLSRAEARLGDWPGGVKAAEALDQARQAQASGDQASCRKALGSARRLIRSS